MSKSLTANFTTEKNKATGAQPRTLLEIDTDSGTVYYSDHAISVPSGNTYSAKVLSWPNRITGQVVPGENVVIEGQMDIELSNAVRVDTDIRPGIEVRLYIWFANLVDADKVQMFKGTISERISHDVYRINFSALDIGDSFNKQIGIPLDTTTYPNADPDDIGKIQPIIYGAVKNSPCLAIVAGAVSTLLNDIAIGAGSIELSDASAFPSSGTLIIGDEEDITYSGKSGNTLTGVANVSFAYARSSRVMEKVASLKYMAAGHITKTGGITNPRIVPNGMKLEDAVRIDAGDFSTNVNDGGIATVTITNIASVKKAVEIAVTTQPNQPITTQQTQVSPAHLHTTTAVITVERHATGIIADSGWTNPTNAFDGDDGTNARVSTGDLEALKLSYNTTDLGTISTAKIVIKSTASSIVTSQVEVGSGQKHNIGTGLATRTFITNITSWSQLSYATAIKPASSPASTMDVYEMYYIVEYVPAIQNTAATVNQQIAAVSNRIQDAVVGGNSVADTLGGTLYVDIDGYQDDGSGTYTGTPNALIEEPWNQIHHILINQSNGMTASDIDLAGSFTDAETNLPASYKFAFRISDKIWMNNLVTRLAEQTFCRFLYEAGVAKLNRIKLSGTSSKNINTDTDTYLSNNNRHLVQIRQRGLNEIYNSIEIKSNINYVNGGWENPDAYNNSDETSNAASLSLFGTRQRTWLMFAIGDNSAMSSDLADKFEELYKVNRKEYIFPTWLKNVELERGDLVDITVPQLGINGRLCEIVEVDYAPPVPVNKRRPELFFKLLDLAFIDLILSDTVTITENVVKDYEKVISESLSITEVVAVVTNYFKIINESLPIYDGTSFLANGDWTANGSIYAVGRLGEFKITFEKILSESLGITEAQVITPQKIIAESLGITEAQVLDFEKIITESLGITEAQVLDFEKIIAESLGITEAPSLEIEKILSESLDIGDVMEYLADGTYTANGSISAIGQINNVEINLEKIFNESMAMGDGNASGQLLANGDWTADGSITAVGQLGEFKITLTKGIAESLGITEVVTPVLNP